METFQTLDNYLYSDEDLRMKFRHSWLLVNIPEAEKIVAQCVEFEDPYVQMNGDRYHRNRVAIVQEIPDVGVFNFNRGICIFSRLSKRQFKRGLNAENASFVDDSNRNLTLTRPLAEITFNKEFTDFEKALAILRRVGGAVTARALNTKYWLKRSHTTTGEVILMRNLINVGLFSKSRFWFNKNCECIKQELNDDLKLDIS